MVMTENLQFRFSMTLDITHDTLAREAVFCYSKSSLGSQMPP